MINLSRVSLIALVTGCAIYLLFRDINSLLITEWLGIGQIMYFENSNRYDNFLVLSLPQGLWSFSGVLLINEIWKNSESHEFYLWIVIFSAMCLMFEPMQFYGAIPGTADIIDELFTAAGLLGALIFIKRRDNYEKRETL